MTFSVLSLVPSYSIYSFQRKSGTLDFPLANLSGLQLMKMQTLAKIPETHYSSLIRNISKEEVLNVNVISGPTITSVT